MRSVSATLVTAQSASPRTPYIHMVYTSKDGLTTRNLSKDSGVYGNRIVLIDHNEEAYNDYAIVMLRDNDSLIPSMLGYWTEIGYGDTTGAGNEYAVTSRLYVKHQRHITAMGKLYTVLELEGLWTRTNDTLIRLGTPPLYQTSYNGTVSSIYTILKAIFVECGMSLPVASPVNDGIIDTMLPVFDINSSPFENGRALIYRLIRMTKCYIRPPSATGLQFGVVYPQAADAVNLTLYSNQAPYFISFMERAPALTPNYFLVYGNRGSNGAWSAYIVSASPNGVSQGDIDALYEVYDIGLAPDATVQADVNNLAAARLLRARAEKDTGQAVIPHDCRIELYDKLAFVDNRRSPATTYPSSSLTRVGGLHHIYTAGKYLLEVSLGGASNTPLDRYTADISLKSAIAGKTTAEMGAFESILENPELYKQRSAPEIIIPKSTSEAIESVLREEQEGLRALSEQQAQEQQRRFVPFSSEVSSSISGAFSTVWKYTKAFFGFGSRDR